MIKNNKRPRNNKKKRNNNNQPQTMLRNRMNVFKSGGVSTVINYPTKIYVYTVSSNYSFASGSDVRSLAFSSIVTGVSPFSDLLLLYSDYRIKAASLIISPHSQIAANTSCGILHVTCDPNGSSSNPSNNTVIATPSAHLFTPVEVLMKYVTFTFPGTGLSSNIWIDSTTTPLGAFYIGQNTTGLGYGSNTIIYDCVFSLSIEFRNLKPN